MSPALRLKTEHKATLPLRRFSAVGDPLADAVALRLDRRRPTNMMNEVLFRAKAEIGVYQEFVDQLYSPPSWVDWQAIEQARHLLVAFNHARSLVVMAAGLIESYCYNRVSQALAERGQLNLEVVRRVHETYRIIQSVTSPECLKPGHSGHRILAEVRLSNAMMRKRLLAKDWAQQNDTQPVNQLDMAFDMLVVGYIANQGMAQLGVNLQPADQEALHHYGRYCAYLYGVNEALLWSKPEDEQRLYQLLTYDKLPVNCHSQMLAQTSLSCTLTQLPINLPLELLQAISRLCLGEAKADALDIPDRPGWRHTLNLYTTANRGASFAYHHLPGMNGLNARLGTVLSQTKWLFPQNSTKKNTLRQIA